MIIETVSVTQINIIDDLEKALLLGDQLALFYQPQVDLTTNKIIGIEALIRWFHPEKGLIPPLEFIPIAEETGLIVPLGKWVLTKACNQLSQWHEEGYQDLKVSVNIATDHFRNIGFYDDIVTILKETSLEPQSLELEITETGLLQSCEAILETFDKLTKLGVSIAIDDFGTGYSSLSYLRNYPIAKLKIDQTFIFELPNKVDCAIVSAIMDMTTNLGIKVIAEGVENATALNYLKNIGCNEIQGYYFSKPLPVNEITTLLIKNRFERHKIINLLEKDNQ
uniref:EAL domain-containing protein n=1 Tax=Anaerobacillus isosaccharinicus TaxID=1532552 RepID=A0A1S2L111_9BACI